MQGRKEIDAYQSDPTKEKAGKKRTMYGPEMLETWLLLEFCDRRADCARMLWLGLHPSIMHSMATNRDKLQMRSRQGASRQLSLRAP